MTDERMGDALFTSIAALPPRSGIIVRHYSVPRKDRQSLIAEIRRLARRGRHLVLVGGIDHGRHRGAVTAPVHSVRERIAAERVEAQLLFVSPVFATRSHPGAKALGRVRFGMLIRGAKRPVIALGGMTKRRAQSLKAFGIYGWAAIDGLIR
jgi:thiamine-phosphate pyrophosphorylase